MKVVGIDEAGRGSLLGEVFACACMFDEGLDLGFAVKDSKLLSPLKRKQIYQKLKNHPGIKFAIGTASLQEIEDLNILNATLLAMERAFLGLNGINLQVMIDGNKKPASMPFAECIIGGDKLVPQISAASIIAKYLRDEKMLEIHALIPHYGINLHKGYGTKLHLEAVKKHGFSEFHRKGWKFARSDVL